MKKVYNVICSLENMEQGHKATYEYQVCAEDDNGNEQEGTNDFIKAVMKRYGIGKKK